MIRAGPYFVIQCYWNFIISEIDFLNANLKNNENYNLLNSSEKAISDYGAILIQLLEILINHYPSNNLTTSNLPASEAMCKAVFPRFVALFCVYSSFSYLCNLIVKLNL